MLKYLFLVGTLGFTVYGQLTIKARAEEIGSSSGGPYEYLLRMLSDPWVISGFLAAGLAALCWLMAVRTLPIAHAYPFMALSFVLVPIGARLFLGEPIGALQVGALLLIVLGVALNAAI